MKYFHITDIEWGSTPLNKVFGRSRKHLPDNLCLTEGVVSQAHGKTNGLEGRPDTIHNLYLELTEILTQLYHYTPTAFDFNIKTIMGGYNWKKIGGNKWKN